MVEQPHAGEGHRDAVLVARFDHVVVTHGAASLRDVFHTTLVRPLDVVAEGEEGIRA